MNKNHLQKAISLAEGNTNDKWNLGAIVVKNGNPISAGINREKNDPKNVPPGFCTVHAEVDAMRQVSERVLNGAVLYVARIRRGGDIGMAKPCLNCRNAVRAGGIKRVYYTISDNEYGVWSV